MISTLSPTLHYMNQYNRKRVLLKRSTAQINDPEVVQQIKGIKKSVKFPVEPQQLEQVRYFYKSQSPKTVQYDVPMMKMCAQDYKIAQPNWPSRNTIFYNTTDQKIRMENVQLLDGDYDQMVNQEFVIEGRCRALNLSFHKVVSIRYTFDLWQTYQETTGEFKESIASTSNTWDRFSFHIPIKAKQNIQSLYLALRYTVDDQEFWDNNNGMNYEVMITPEVIVEEEEQATTIETTVVTRTKEDEEELATIKDNTKILGRRYDFTASLTAARKPYSFASPPPSPPATPIDTENFSSYTPPIFFNECVETYHVVVDVPKSASAEPMPISHPPISAEGFQMSYSDFVNKYCFYNSHSNPIYNTLSTSPSAVLS